MNNQTIPDNNYIQNRITELFDGNEWISHRYYFRKIRDHQVFVSANILAILANCDIHNHLLKQQIDTCRKYLKTYQKDHLTYFWPLKNGRSVMPNSRLLSKMRMFDLSPDADVTCLNQIALSETNNIDKITDELIFYCVDNNNFRLPECQLELPEANNTFLTWFPDKKYCKNRKIETVDVAVDANILWFLTEFDRLNIKGCRETISFVENILKSDILINNPFKVSHYYPFVPVILYFISRAIVWGNIKQMLHLKDIILEIANKLTPQDNFQRLCLCSVFIYFGLKNEAQKLLENINFRKFETGTFYVAPFLAPLMLRMPILELLAKRPEFHVKFKSEALQWAMMLWIIQNLN